MERRTRTPSAPTGSERVRRWRERSARKRKLQARDTAALVVAISVLACCVVLPALRTAWSERRAAVRNEPYQTVEAFWTPPSVDDTASAPPRRTRRLADEYPFTRADFEWTGRTWSWRYPNGDAIRCLGRSDGIYLVTDVGPIVVSDRVLRTTSAGPPAELPRLLALARTVDEVPDRWELAYEPLLGHHLAQHEHLVLTSGFLSRTALPLDHRDSDEAALRRLVENISASPSLEKMGTRARRALLSHLRSLLAKPRERAERTILPATLRRMVRHGWLEHFPLTRNERGDLEAATRAVDAVRPTARWANDAMAVSRHQARDGEIVLTMTSSARSAYQRAQITAAYLDEAVQRVGLFELDPGDDPLSPKSRIRSAEVRLGHQVVAQWTRGMKEIRGVSGWQRPIDAHGRTSPWLPPHVALTHPNGDVQSLITEYGLIELQGASYESFLEQCVEALPDAPHLDLIGQILLDYALDSWARGDTSLPGTEQFLGDWIQTARQTFRTLRGGRLRGDCDDLAALYHAILSEQDHIPLLLALPGHVACAHVEVFHKAPHLFVLHTGPPILIQAHNASIAVETAFEHYEGVLDVATHWIPAWLPPGTGLDRRICVDPEAFFHADQAQLIDSLIQDERNHALGAAYLRLLHSVEGPRPIEANRWSLARAQAALGMRTEAVKNFNAVLTQTRSPDDRVQLLIAMLEVDPGFSSDTRLRDLAWSLLCDEIPKVEARHRTRIVDEWLRVATALLDREVMPTLSLQVLHGRVFPRIEGALVQLVQQIESGDTDQQMSGPIRRRLRQIAEVGIRALDFHYPTLSPTEKRAFDAIDAWVRAWFLRVAFPTTSEKDPLRDHALLARYYAVRLGAAPFERLIQLAADPTAETSTRPMDLTPTQAPVELLRWWRVSPRRWREAWIERCRVETMAIDTKAVLADIQRHRQAVALTRALGHDCLHESVWETEADVATALLQADPAALAEALGTAKEDASRRDACLAVYTLLARHLELDWFKQATSAWAVIIDHPPHYFRIVHAALRAGAEKKALFLADLACARHPETQRFQDERAYIRARVFASHD